MDTTEKTTGESVWLKTGTKKVVGLKWGPSPPFLIIGCIGECPSNSLFLKNNGEFRQ